MQGRAGVVRPLSLHLTPARDADIFDNAAVAAIGFAVALPSGAPHLFGAVARDAKEVFQPAAL